MSHEEVFTILQVILNGDRGDTAQKSRQSPFSKGLYDA